VITTQCENKSTLLGMTIDQVVDALCCPANGSWSFHSGVIGVFFGGFGRWFAQDFANVNPLEMVSKIVQKA
jgi:hypothetical protein